MRGGAGIHILKSTEPRKAGFPFSVIITRNRFDNITTSNGNRIFSLLRVCMWEGDVHARVTLIRLPYVV